MKVTCVLENSGMWFTLGKNYILELVDNNTYYITNDKGYKHYIHNDEIELIFIDTKVNRDNKLKQMGI